MKNMKNMENMENMENTKLPTHIKHNKYANQYIPNELYWGLGIENEIYLEFQEKQKVKKTDFIKSCKRERYSVDYFTNYKKNISDNALKNYVQQYNENETTDIPIPILLNSNSFMKTDRFNNAKNLYTKLCEPNIKFVGETLIETLHNSENDFFRNTMDKEWLFDGDTIEFNTLRFYNPKLNDVLEELSHYKKEFIQEINDSFEKMDIFRSYGKINIMSGNHPFATFMTNFPKITIFNNGTLHYNLTLPTQLNHKCKIQNYDSFLQDHKKAIRMIQFIEPFLISVYGTPDPFSIVDFSDSQLFSKSSQRCAVSRYIGIGTYDSDTMERGKILTKTLDELKMNYLDYWWFHTFYKDNAYTKLNEIGLDFNFNKHYNHGIELRFLEHITDETKLKESFEFIILLMDFILDSDNNINKFGNPIYHKTWNEFVSNIMFHGNTYELNNEEKELYEFIFNIKIKSLKTIDVYYEIYNNLLIRYSHINPNETGTKNPDNLFLCIPNGNFSKLTLQPQLRKIVTDNNIFENSQENESDLLPKHQSIIKNFCCFL